MNNIKKIYKKKPAMSKTTLAPRETLIGMQKNNIVV